jgi:hypothetical protein
MNILPIVFAFLIIFSFLTFGFIQDHAHAILSEKSFKSFYDTSRIASNAVAQKLYKRIKSPPPLPNPSEKPAASTKPVTARKKQQSLREVFPPLDNSKLNLMPLFALQTEPKNHPLYEICASLLHVLYEESLFKQTKQEGLEYDLLNAMIKTYRTKGNIKTLSDLYPDAPHLKPIFYKMLKGTNQYNAASKSGIAPMEDFFILDKTPAIHFACASRFLLEALFGEKIALKILAEEKKKYETTGKKASLTQEDLTGLLANDPLRASLVLELGQHIDFSVKNPKRVQLSQKDKTSGLVVKKPL